MKKLLVLFFTLFNIYNSFSCSCSHKTITQQEYDKYSLIFIGKITEVEDCDNEGYQEFTFEVEQIFKGQTTKFVSGFNNCGGTCNYIYSLGQKWLVYSNPEYGLINDQYACNPSIAIANKENEILIGKDYNISDKEWNFEVDFLQSRITKDVKIFNFQFEKFVPLLRNILIVTILILFLLLSYKFKLKLLPYSIGLGIVSGILYYLLIKANYFEELKARKIIYIVVPFCLLLSCNFIFSNSIKNKITFKKTFIFNYLLYISMICTSIYMIIINEYQKIEFDSAHYKVFLIILGIGILFSLFVALIIEGYKRLKTKRATYNNG